MEKSVGISLLEEINQTFVCEPIDVRTYSPLTLAYIGDAIYDVIIRTLVVERANRSAKDLHRTTIRFVNAATQARMIELLEEQLTEDEKAVFHRGRNAKSGTSAKNASIVDYRKATGFEALIGYLYLQGQMSRAMELIKYAIDKLDLKW